MTQLDDGGQFAPLTASMSARRFSEQLTVCDRGAAKLPEAMVGEDACDARLTGIGTQKGLMHEMHSAQGEITDRPHAEMLFASGGSLAASDGRANFGEIKLPVGMFLQELLELLHDRVMTAVTKA